MSSPALATTVIGSYPQPDWLIDREKLRGSLPPRIRARELWRVAEPYLAAGAGRRHGARDRRPGARRRRHRQRRRDPARELLQPLRHRARGLRHRQHRDRSPAAPAGPTRCRASSAGSAARGRSRSTTCASCAAARDATIKITLPGPFTMSQQAANEAYDDEAELAMDLAVAVNEEVRDLFAAGADVVQIDEPWLQSPAGEGARVRARPRSTARSRARPGRPRCTPASATRHVVHDRPSGYPFLAELADCAADVLAIEAAQPRLDLRRAASRSPARR